MFFYLCAYGQLTMFFFGQDCPSKQEVYASMLTSRVFSLSELHMIYDLQLKDPLCIISASFHQASTFPKTFSHNPTKKPLLPSWKYPWPKIQAHMILQKNIFLKWAYDIKSPFDPQPVPSFAGVSFLFEQCQDMLIFLIGIVWLLLTTCVCCMQFLFFGACQVCLSRLLQWSLCNSLLPLRC